MKTHYLDHNAGTVVDPRVLDRFLEVERRCPGNPGSLHATGRQARAALEDARQETATALGVAESEVLFVSGGTEANNLAVAGSGDPSLPVLLSEAEHPSVREAAMQRRGCVFWQVDPRGRVVVEHPEGTVGLLSLVHGQNEVGTLQPVAAAGGLAAELGVPLHVDAAQTLGRIPLDEPLEHAHTVVLSCHKAGGLKGIGVLIVRAPHVLRPVLHGGGQEGGLRPGTPSPALAASAARTVALAVRETAMRAAAMRAARRDFLLSMREGGVVPHSLTPLEESLPNTLMLSFDDVDGRSLLPALDLGGVQASQGSACSSGSPTPPRILDAMGLSEDAARRCVRFSFAVDHSLEDVRRAGRTVASVVLRLRKKSFDPTSSH